MPVPVSVSLGEVGHCLTSQRSWKECPEDIVQSLCATGIWTWVHLCQEPELDIKIQGSVLLLIVLMLLTEIANIRVRVEINYIDLKYFSLGVFLIRTKLFPNSSFTLCPRRSGK